MVRHGTVKYMAVWSGTAFWWVKNRDSKKLLQLGGTWRVTFNVVKHPVLPTFWR